MVTRYEVTNIEHNTYLHRLSQKIRKKIMIGVEMVSHNCKYLVYIFEQYLVYGRIHLPPNKTLTET